MPEVEEVQEFQRLLLNQKEEKFLRQESLVHQILKLEQVQLLQERLRSQLKPDVFGSLTDKERIAREKALLDADTRRKDQAALEKEISKNKSNKKEANNKEQASIDLPSDGEFEKSSKKKTFNSKKTETQSSSTRKKESKGEDKDKTTKKSKNEPQKRRKGKLTISEALNENERQRSLASIRRRQEKAKKKAVISDAPKEKISRNVVIPESITVQELSNRMAEEVLM